MRNYSCRVLAFALCCLLAGCSTVEKKTESTAGVFTESGKASFYSSKHQGRKTASGEIYSHALSTAAHKTLPFGSNVKVTNTDNDKSVIVKINDRGPFIKGRIIDLSRSAFSSIGDTSSGVIDVKIEVIQ